MEEELLIEWLNTHIGKDKWWMSAPTRTVRIDGVLPDCHVTPDYMDALRLLVKLAREKGFGPAKRVTPAPDPDAH
jgi:hypothetical protein